LTAPFSGAIVWPRVALFYAPTLALFYLRIAILGNILAHYTEGKLLYEMALERQDIHRKISLLERAVRICGEFHACYELGKAYMAVERLHKADQAFRDAMGFPASDREIARLLADHGFLCQTLNREHDAVLFLSQSYEKYPYPIVLAKLKEIETERARKGMDAVYIKKALSRKAMFGVEPSLNIRIGFQFDSASLDPSGQDQAREFGKALTDPAFKGKMFTLIGHTDNRGTCAYNQGLSEERALSVKIYLTAHFSLDPSRILTQGRGEGEPLYEGDTEDEHALNRRVEVKVGKAW